MATPHATKLMAEASLEIFAIIIKAQRASGRTGMNLSQALDYFVENGWLPMREFDALIEDMRAEASGRPN